MRRVLKYGGTSIETADRIRRAAQTVMYRILDGLLRKHGSGISKVIDIQVPTLELIRRLDARSHTERQMPYDSSTSRIVKRLHEHETKTLPVIEKYKKHRDVATIDGTGSFDEVFERLSREVEAGITGRFGDVLGRFGIVRKPKAARSVKRVARRAKAKVARRRAA